MWAMLVDYASWRYSARSYPSPPSIFHECWREGRRRCEEREQEVKKTEGWSIKCEILKVLGAKGLCPNDENSLGYS